jgi:hypothetical protein
MWISLQKTQRRVMTLRHSPLNDTPNAATVAVTACGVPKIFLFVSILHIAVHGRSDTLPVVTATVAAWGVSLHGLWRLIKYRS